MEGAAPSRLAAALGTVGKRATATVADEWLTVARVEGSAIGLLDAVAILAAAEEDAIARAPASLAAWSLAAKLALELVGRERLVPRARITSSGAVEARWSISLSLAEDAERAMALARAFPPAAHAVPAEVAPPSVKRGSAASAASRRRRPRTAAAASVWAPEALLRAFLDFAADTIVRSAVKSDGARRRSDSSGAQAWERRFAAGLTSASATLGTGFRERALAGELEAWSGPAVGLDPGSPRACLRLELPAEPLSLDANRAGGRAARGTDRFALRYFLQAADDPSLLIPASTAWSARGRTLQHLGRTFREPQEQLLRSLAIAARIFPPIERSLHEARPAGVSLDPREAWTLLADAAAALQEAGLGVILPAELTRSGERRLRLRMRVGSPSARAAGVVGGTSGLGLGAVLAFNWEVALGDETLSAADLAALARLKAPLVRYRGRWVAVDAAELEEVRRLLAKGGGTLLGSQALAMALTGSAQLPGISLATEVLPDGPFAERLERLRAGPPPDGASPPAALHGTLRPYQVRGLAWLDSMAELELGSCLADDMGLGKTIQVLAFFLRRRELAPHDLRPALVVCPTSVVGNWEREVARFAPSLPVVRHYGGARARSAEALAGLAPSGVVLTTYAVLRRDAETLGGVDWAAAVLDEAQNIKNAGSRTARAARALRASHRLALTGTPIENRLAEVWSILEFANPGMLGSLEAFRREYAVPIERYRNDVAVGRLRRIVQPFILRRLKSDPAVIRDLPAKQEMTVVCSLTREQATLYQAALDDALREIGRADGVRRRGLVLALLTALKQICNHPAHYLGERGPLAGRSGKLARLEEMLDEVVASGDRALVFTQFREMGDRLVEHLGRALETEILFLHGGVRQSAREAMVRRFQDDAGGSQVFVLSLRAGGTGLNLTAATHVFHFDRWWNPAVEDQATDRAYRIGQRRLVQVHALLSAGTVEERIARLLEQKRDLAGRIVGAGEHWITELDDEALQALCALSEDAVIETDEPERDSAKISRSPRPAHPARAQVAEVRS